MRRRNGNGEKEEEIDDDTRLCDTNNKLIVLFYVKEATTTDPKWRKTAKAEEVHVHDHHLPPRPRKCLNKSQKPIMMKHLPSSTRIVSDRSISITQTEETKSSSSQGLLPLPGLGCMPTIQHNQAFNHHEMCVGTYLLLLRCVVVVGRYLKNSGCENCNFADV